MNLRRFVLIFCIAALCLLTVFPPAAWAFQNMACSSSGTTDRTTCFTAQEESNGTVKITCRAVETSRDVSTTFTCVRTTRDWGKLSAPYAHASTTWRCINGSKENFIFAADFDSDTVRCDLICGKCATAWRVQP